MDFDQEKYKNHFNVEQKENKIEPFFLYRNKEKWFVCQLDIYPPKTKGRLHIIK